MCVSECALIHARGRAGRPVGCAGDPRAGPGGRGESRRGLLGGPGFAESGGRSGGRSGAGWAPVAPAPKRCAPLGAGGSMTSRRRRHRESSRTRTRAPPSACKPPTVVYTPDAAILNPAGSNEDASRMVGWFVAPGGPARRSARPGGGCRGGPGLGGLLDAAIENIETPWHTRHRDTYCKKP